MDHDLPLGPTGRHHRIDGKGGSCSLAADPEAPEVCNGVDDDCDDLVDEGFIDPISGRPVGEFCDGVGACASDEPSLVVCSADGSSALCQANAAGGLEVFDCESGDEDCDGEINEGVSLAPPVSLLSDPAEPAAYPKIAWAGPAEERPQAAFTVLWVGDSNNELWARSFDIHGGGVNLHGEGPTMAYDVGDRHGVWWHDLVWNPVSRNFGVALARDTDGGWAMNLLVSTMGFDLSLAVPVRPDGGTDRDYAALVHRGARGWVAASYNHQRGALYVNPFEAEDVAEGSVDDDDASYVSQGGMDGVGPPLTLALHGANAAVAAFERGGQLNFAYLPLGEGSLDNGRQNPLWHIGGHPNHHPVIRRDPATERFGLAWIAGDSVYLGVLSIDENGGFVSELGARQPLAIRFDGAADVGVGSLDMEMGGDGQWALVWDQGGQVWFARAAADASRSTDPIRLSEAHVHRLAERPSLVSGDDGFGVSWVEHNFETFVSTVMVTAGVIGCPLPPL